MNTSLSGVAPIDRRTELRIEATGNVLIRQYNQTFVAGDVMDQSLGGFRMRYFGKRMKVGSVVEILTPWKNTTAILAWTIRSRESMQAGFRFSSDPLDLTLADDEHLPVLKAFATPLHGSKE